MPIKETHSVTSGTAEEKDNLPARKFLLPPNLVHPKGFELTLQDEELIRVMEPLYAASIPESFSPLCTLDWFILVHGDKPLDKYGSAFSVNKNRLGKILREEGYKIGRIVKQDHDGKHIPYFYISALTSAEIEELNKSNLTDPDKRPYKEYPKSPHILELEEKKREEINQALTIQVVYCLNNRGSLDSLQKPRAIIEEACESKGLDIYALIGCNQAGYLSENPAIYYVSGIFETLKQYWNQERDSGLEGILTRGCQELIKKGYKVEEIVQQLCKKAEVDFGYFKDDDFEPLPQVKLPHRLMRGRDSKQDADGYISTEGQKGDIPELLLKSGDDTARLHL